MTVVGRSVLVVACVIAANAVGYWTGKQVAVDEEYRECVKLRGIAPPQMESCGSILEAEHGEFWRRGRP